MFVINSDGNVIGIKNSLDDLVDFVELIGRMISVFRRLIATYNFLSGLVVVDA